MRLEVGKCVGNHYRTRNGRKATILAIVPPPPGLAPWMAKPVFGYLDGERCYQTWTRDGTFLAYGDTDHVLDLIEEWVDPPTCREVCERVISEGLTNPEGIPHYIVAAAREALKHEGR